MQAHILVFDGFDEMDAIAPWEVLRNAGAMGATVDAHLVAVDGPAEIVAARGLRVHADARSGTPDVLVVPGGSWNDPDAGSGTRHEVARGVIPKAIAESHADGALVAGVCTGAMLMAAAGLLRDRPAVTHHGALADLEKTGACVVDARVVDDGDIVTSGGVTSGLDLSLWLVERLFGPQLARAIEVRMEYERRGTVWRSSGK